MFLIRGFMNNIKISTRLLVSFGLITVVSVATVYAAMRTLRVSNAAYAQLMDSVYENLPAEISDASLQAIRHAADLLSADISAQYTAIIMIGVPVALISVILTIYNTIYITKSIRAVIVAAGKIAKGNFNVNVGSQYKDEIAQLSNSLLYIKQTVSSLTSDLKETSAKFQAGDVDVVLDENCYEGEFNRVANDINSLLSAATTDTEFILDHVSEFGKGNFNAQIKQLPGKKIVISQSLESVQSNIKQFNLEISEIAKVAANGDLNLQMSTNRYQGDWNKVAHDINRLLGAVVDPIREAISVLNELSDCNLKASVKGHYNGEFDRMKNALNSSIYTMSDYVKEINDVLLEISGQNLSTPISRDYIGDFSSIRNSINLIIDSLSTRIYKINETANLVATSAENVAQSSGKLAATSLYQSKSVKDFEVVLERLTDSIVEDASNIKKVSSLMDTTTNYVETGSSSMKDMLASMQEINSASNNISQVIKVIEDIAFQTNLLSLNASVEAARAGQYGKGFAVVAEEVRNLAVKSQDAVHQTAQLLSNSFDKVSEGSKIATITDETFQNMVKEIIEMQTVVKVIIASFDEQLDELMPAISSSIQNISKTIAESTDTTETQAADAQKLASESEVLDSMFSSFKLA